MNFSQVAGVRNTINSLHEDLGFLQQTVEQMVCNVFTFLLWPVDCYRGCLASIDLWWWIFRSLAWLFDFHL